MKNLASTLLFIVLTLMPQAAHAASDVPIELNITRSLQQKGVYNFWVDYAGPAASGEIYTIYCFLDNRLEVEFAKQSLPHAFPRNFRGQAAGQHEIKIVLKDQNGKEIASSTKILNVRQ